MAVALPAGAEPVGPLSPSGAARWKTWGVTNGTHRLVGLHVDAVQRTVSEAWVSVAQPQPVSATTGEWWWKTWPMQWAKEEVVDGLWIEVFVLEEIWVDWDRGWVNEKWRKFRTLSTSEEPVAATSQEPVAAISEEPVVAAATSEVPVAATATSSEVPVAATATSEVPVAATATSEVPVTSGSGQ